MRVIQKHHHPIHFENYVKCHNAFNNIDIIKFINGLEQ